MIFLEKYFPCNHIHASFPTHFRDELLLAQKCPDCSIKQKSGEQSQNPCKECFRATLKPKIHIIKTNYSLWEKRIQEVKAGLAVLSIRQWSGLAHKSKQETLAKFDKTSNIEIQKLSYNLLCEVDDKERCRTLTIATNDGMSLEDWRASFSNDSPEPLAIIHLTGFRY